MRMEEKRVSIGIESEEDMALAAGLGHGGGETTWYVPALLLVRPPS